ncbi:DUF3895 domain-containing protein [Sutcliffiella horikoshii]|uniref:DUF3895 domain-containing protein n=1 Tax=Sutcliffiella horikoshii TaxID=79883 RepID=UPI00203D19CA|nr:DUF3895 domain-containing protein [Sutcliffiella horikoshii]
MKKVLSQKERDELLDLVTETQREYLIMFLKRGKKTQFSNLIANWKASSVEDEEVEVAAASWELIDYIDAGPDWQSDSLYCACGRQLRRQYKVSNTLTGEVKTFGIQHFQDHTQIEPELVRDIIKGFERIDYELDEVLLKMVDGWTLEAEWLPDIPKDFVFSTDIEEHLNQDIPLLERQVERLRYEIRQQLKEKDKQITELTYKRQVEARKKSEALLKAASLELSNKIKEEKQKQDIQAEKEKKAATEKLLANRQKKRIQIDISKNRLSLNKKYQEAIIEIINQYQSEEVDTLDVCWELINRYGANSQLYSSSHNKPKIYFDVQLFMKMLEAEGVLKLQTYNHENCFYSILTGAKLEEDQQMNLF